jgi:hypothetical protein
MTFQIAHSRHEEINSPKSPGFLKRFASPSPLFIFQQRSKGFQHVTAARLILSSYQEWDTSFTPVFIQGIGGRGNFKGSFFFLIDENNRVRVKLIEGKF